MADANKGPRPDPPFNFRNPGRGSGAAGIVSRIKGGPVPSRGPKDSGGNSAKDPRREAIMRRLQAKKSK